MAALMASLALFEPSVVLVESLGVSWKVRDGVGDVVYFGEAFPPVSMVERRRLSSATVVASLTSSSSSSDRGVKRGAGKQGEINRSGGGLGGCSRRWVFSPVAAPAVAAFSQLLPLLAAASFWLERGGVRAREGYQREGEVESAGGGGWWVAGEGSGHCWRCCFFFFAGQNRETEGEKRGRRDEGEGSGGVGWWRWCWW